MIHRFTCFCCGEEFRYRKIGMAVDFRAHYQPTLETSSVLLCSSECLVSWMETVGLFENFGQSEDEKETA